MARMLGALTVEARAAELIERAKAQATDTTMSMSMAAGEHGGPRDDVSPLLAEALLVLANLTADENKREELYARAQAEAGEDLKLDPVDMPMPVARMPEVDADDAMDTSM